MDTIGTGDKTLIWKWLENLDDSYSWTYSSEISSKESLLHSWPEGERNEQNLFLLLHVSEGGHQQLLAAQLFFSFFPLIFPKPDNTRLENDETEDMFALPGERVNKESNDQRWGDGAE